MTNEPGFDPDREKIHELLSSFGGPDAGLEGVLVGWVAIAEWSLSDGKRILTFLSADAKGESAPSWQSVGYLRNGLGRCEPIYIARGAPPPEDDE